MMEQDKNATQQLTQHPSLGEGLGRPVIICVGRQLGSGGHDIARMLAMDFNAKYYDRELLNLAAKESGFSEKFFEQNDEKKGFLRNLLSVQATHLSGASLYKSNFSQESLFQFQSDAIRKAAEEGNCVFVGRCADYVLRDMPNVVSVFITASMRDRVEKLLAQRSMSPHQAKRFILDAEEKRASYYNYYTGKKWGAAESYDLCINSSILGLVETEKLIADFIRKRFSLTSHL
jgi:cytidylate kinase